MMQLEDDPIPGTRVPMVKDLCEALGFGASSLPFQKSLNHWRKNYRTASGKSGMNITNWALETDRYELGVMAQHYLQTGDHARKNWPPSEEASPRVKPEYPKDEIM